MAAREGIRRDHDGLVLVLLDLLADSHERLLRGFLTLSFRLRKRGEKPALLLAAILLVESLLRHAHAMWLVLLHLLLMLPLDYELQLTPWSELLGRNFVPRAIGGVVSHFVLRGHPEVTLINL